MCMSGVLAYVFHVSGTHGGQKAELDLQIAVNHLWVLGTKP